MTCHSEVPTTPPKSNPEAHSEFLLSTPSSRGGSAISEDTYRFTIRHVKPVVLADVKKHDTCTVNQILTAFLNRCLPETMRKNPPADLLDTCLKAVLPVCNKPGSKLRTSLKEYCGTGTETGRYAPFIKAFNAALQDFSELKNLPLREPSDIKVMLHRNHPSVIFGSHKGLKSSPKPDVVIASSDSVKRATGRAGPWTNHALPLEYALSKPKKNFTWRDVLSSFEFKLKRKHLGHVPETFLFKPVTQIDPQTFETMVKEIRSLLYVEEMQQEPTSNASTSAKNSEGGPVVKPRRSSCLSALATEPQTGIKRSGGDYSSQKSVKRQKPEDIDLEKLPAMLQTAMYGAERMSHAPWVTSAINLVVIDDVVYVWYYDHESAIQSYGFNFIKDLPHFLVLLLAFQRFTLEDWGVSTALHNAAYGIEPFHFKKADIGITLKVDQCFREHFGITGRATRVFGATSTSKDPRHATDLLSNKELVAKIYHPETSRYNEVEVITKARQLGANDPEIRDHLPEVVVWFDFPESDTQNIRRALGIYQPAMSKRSRVMRIVVVPRYYPITGLVGSMFWDIFWQCFRCHYRLWLHGIEHGDISPGNLMYEKKSDGKLLGILNDFDLAHVQGHARPPDWERTGTMPFMALDLLTDEAWDGKVERLYRHDCESFGWVLLWICARYEDGKEIPNPPFENWCAHSYDECRLVKEYQSFVNVKGTSSYEMFWPCARVLRRTHQDRYDADRRALDLAVLVPYVPPPEPSTAEAVGNWITVFHNPVFQAIGNPLKDLKLEL